MQNQAWPQIIQGGMGVAISGWELARTVSTTGNLGVVSGTGVAIALIHGLWKGDEGGHYRRALAQFPDQEVAQRVKDKYFNEGGSDAPTPHTKFYSLNTSQQTLELTIAANFAEVWLAKEGHDNMVGVNLLEKTPLPNLPSLYGAMLAGVDVVIMGAGIPIHVPGVLASYVTHSEAKYPLEVAGAELGERHYTTFDPQAVLPLAKGWAPLKLPKFFPIVTTPVTANVLIKRATGPIDGFIVETPVAGGHNAPPRGNPALTADGEATYSDRDFAAPKGFLRFGLPFWMAGGYGDRAGLVKAVEEGAQGIQVGTAFAYADESGFTPEIRAEVLGKSKTGQLRVKTDGRASPTGFPFKVVPVEGSLSDAEVAAKRTRVCDLGYLRHLYKREDGKLGYRCPSEPEAAWLRKGGKPEELEGRLCLCNALGSALGIRLAKKNDYHEPVLVTSGDAVAEIAKYLPPGKTSYNVLDVLDVLEGRREETPLPKRVESVLLV
jgi:nitronate monooxygenase